MLVLCHKNYSKNFVDRALAQHEKEKLRRYYKGIRRNLTAHRREKASKQALRSFAALTKTSENVLSYSSFRDEFPTNEINQYLEKAGKLILPKIDGRQLRLFHISNSKEQLEINRLGILEPIPELAEETDHLNVACAIIPALAFDSNLNRLGYGKGFYDRTLSKLTPGTIAYGLGFLEQYRNSALPYEPHDLPLSHLLLF